MSCGEIDVCAQNPASSRDEEDLHHRVFEAVQTK
jgi:hypothetical protein